MRKIYFSLVVLAALCSSLTSCQDKVDDGSMYTFTGQLISDYISADENLSHFCYLTKKVKLSSMSNSTVYDLLSARGNYTCFLPSNEAIQNYLDSLYYTKDYDITQVPDSTAEFIVNNSLIDHNDSPALLSTDFYEGTIETQSFAGRFVTVNFDTIEGGHAAIYIDKFSRITASDVEVENGVIHKVDQVVAPTTSSLSSLIEATANLQVFSNLLKATGFDEVLNAPFRDMDYEANHPKTGLGCPTETGENPVPTPAHRDKGFTAFVEPDSLYAAAFGFTLDIQKGQIANWAEIFPIIEKKCKEYYPNATDPDYTSDNNAVHQFVGYHLLDRSVPYNLLNCHYNEMGFTYRSPENLSIDTWCYYPTLTQNRILKVMEGKQIKGKRINRYVSERNLNNYAEITVPRPGILLSNTGDNSALNGYFYVIDDVLVYDDDVPNKVLNERMRYDLNDFFPEIMSSGYRRITSGDCIKGMNIPIGYHSTMWFSSESSVVALPGYPYLWRNYQGDEYNIVGQYDVTLQLPHVPYYGTYELRVGLSNNSVRGMCQLYIGTNRENLTATGLPLDMRISSNHDLTGWEEENDDPDVNTETDKRMRLHGYMKPPKYFGFASTAATTTNFRDYDNVLRAICYTGTMDPKKTYYLRMKSVLENTSTQLFLDYFELVPKSVYNGAVEEDAW